MFSLFRRRRSDSSVIEVVRGLQVEGVAAPRLTPEPDEAELAATALLEMTAGPKHGAAKTSDPRENKERDAEYYHALAGRIAVAHEAERRAALRYVAFSEEQLTSAHCPLSAIEDGLYKHIETIEREGGELKRRWQHCMADVTVRQMWPVYG